MSFGRGWNMVAGRRAIGWCIGVGVCGVMAVSALAQTGAAPNPGTREGASVGSDGGAALMDIVSKGGWPMYVLAAMSIFGLALVLYFFVVMRVGAVVPRALHREILEKIGAGAFDEARKVCDYRPCALSSVALVAMDYMRSVPNADHAIVKDVAESEGGRHGQRIEAQTQLLWDLSTIAPMVGLLGTVLGMLKAFGAVAIRDAAAKPVQLASGVGQALVTTAFGLLVAIPAMMFYAYFRRRAAQQVAALETASTEVLTALLSKNMQL